MKAKGNKENSVLTAFMMILGTITALVLTAASAPEISATILIASSELVSSAPTALMNLVEVSVDVVEIGAAIVLDVISSRAAGTPVNSML